MTRAEFNAKIQEINTAKLAADIGPLSAGACIKEICIEWLKDHHCLPPGFEGFDDGSIHKPTRKGV